MSVAVQPKSGLVEERMFLGRIALDYLPRLLGLGDRFPDSPTYGCFDRGYWHYRIVDTANARYQEAALTMALAYASPVQGNPFRGRDALVEWARAAVAFWVRNQHRDGSVHEVYPYERSFCATSFSTWAMAETAIRLQGQADFAFARTPLARAAGWLQANDCELVANQRAAACLAMVTVGQWLSDEGLIRAGRDLLSRILDSILPEGDLPEYGRGDVGYQSLSLSCLNQVRVKLGESAPSLQQGIARAISWLETRVGDEGRYDPCLGSRGTQWLYPSCLMASCSPAGLRLIEGLKANRVICPAWLDDRYSIGLATDYLLCACQAEAPAC
jgi:hypothetical protein